MTRLAAGLGWFSIGLGAVELAAPAMIAKLIGARSSKTTHTTLRIFGVREILAGSLILLGPRRPLPLWNRVLGDALDLGALAFAMRRRKAARARLLASMASVVGVTVLDVIAALFAEREQATLRKPVVAAITVQRPVPEVYAAWRNFEKLPRFMTWLESVHKLGSNVAEWTARLPMGGTFSWTAVTTEDRPNERIAWRTADKSQVPSRGMVWFRPTLDGTGTEVELETQYSVPGSRQLGALFAKLATREQASSDLKRFKQVLETGEVVHADARGHVS